MLIASYFKRPKAPVNMPKAGGGTIDYFFTPVDPTNPESEHVADVKDPAHIQRFLQIAEGYYVAEANAAIEALTTAAATTARPAAAIVDPPKPSAAPQQEAAPSTPAPSTAAPAAPTSDPAAATATDDDTAAKALLALPLAKFKAELKTTSRAVLAAALAMESDKGNDERATVVKHLKAALA